MRKVGEQSFSRGMVRVCRTLVRLKQIGETSLHRRGYCMTFTTRTFIRTAGGELPISRSAMASKVNVKR